jgi:hypothetical protein
MNYRRRMQDGMSSRRSAVWRNVVQRVFQYILETYVGCPRRCLGGMYDPAGDVVVFTLSAFDTEYDEWDSVVLADWLLPLRLSKLDSGSPSVRLEVDAYSCGSLGSTSTYVPRSIAWLEYATNGFTKAEVTIRIQSPYGNGFGYDDWLEWSFYQDCVYSLGCKIEIEPREDYDTALCCYEDVLFRDVETWRHLL